MVVSIHAHPTPVATAVDTRDASNEMTIALLNALLMVSGLLTLGGCGGADAPLEEEAPPDEDVSMNNIVGDDIVGGVVQAAPATARVPEKAFPPLVVELKAPMPAGRFRWETETIGVHTVLLEAGLLELHGVIVETNGRPTPPGLYRPVGVAKAERWTATLEFGDEPDALEVELELCTPDGKTCRSTAATAGPAEPQRATAKLLAFAAEVLDRKPAKGAIAQWSVPLSQDPYAILIAGRSAAGWYNLMEWDGDTDPVVRAVLIDPTMALAQWLLARRYVETDRWDKALPHFAAAREGRPLAPIMVADEAIAMERTNRVGAAADLWDMLLDANPRDPRFQLARAENDLRALRLDDAQAELERLAADWPGDSGVAAARVTLADKRGEEKGMDELLAHWARTDKTAVEPVRRRIQLRVRQTDYEDAWRMLPTLRERGADALADNYELPLGIALQKWDTAATAAERSGRPDVAALIRAREALTNDPTKAPELDSGRLGADAYLVLGWVALRQNRPKDALAYAESADRLRPWDPDVMTLTRDALALLGNSSAAQRVADRIAAAEPPSPAVMVNATATR
jgi:tetratricopeptide (TPR) repeat protein